MKLSAICIALVATSSASAYSAKLFAREEAPVDSLDTPVPHSTTDEKAPVPDSTNDIKPPVPEVPKGSIPPIDPNNEAARKILEAVTEAAKKKAMEKGKELVDKKKAELLAKAEASIEDSKRIALQIFETLKHHSLLKIKEIAAQLLQLIKQKVEEALTKGKQVGEEIVDKKKEALKGVIDEKLGTKPANPPAELVAREFDEFDLEDRAFFDDAMVQVFILLKRSGLINNIIRQSLIDPQVRAGVADITIELVDSGVIPYEEVFEALMSSGMALDVVKFSLTDAETRSGLVSLIVELIPELFRSGALNPWDYISGPDFVANGASGVPSSQTWTTVTTSSQPLATAA